MLSSSRAGLGRTPLSALAVQSEWEAFDLRVSRCELADDPEKDRLRNEEADYFRAAVSGMPAYAFERLFRQQLAQDPPEGANEENTYYLPE